MRTRRAADTNLVPRRFQLRRPEPCAICVRGLAPEEIAAGDVVCLACDPGWSQPVAVAAPAVAAREPASPAARGTSWFSRKRFSGR